MEWHGEHFDIFFLCTAFLLSVLGFFAVTWATTPCHHKHAWPSGPFAWPIIGHLHLLGKLPHVSLYELSKQYGPLMGLQLGRFPTIVASSPEMAREILHVHDAAFASRPPSEAASQLLFESSDIVFAPQGLYWRLMRQLCVADLLTVKRIQESREVREEEVRGLVRDVLEKGMGGQKEVEVWGSLLSGSNNINCRIALGGRLREFSCRMKEGDLSHLVTELLCLMGVFQIGDFIPALKWVDVQGYRRRMMQTREAWSGILQQVIDKRREVRRGGSRASAFLDVLLDASANNNHQLPISDDNIKGVLLDLFTGGSETTASTVEWALAELLNHPTNMQKVQEELDNVVGKSCLVEDAHIQKLPYFRAVVKEVLRLHPPAPLLVPHETNQECVVAGYTIPAKTRAYVNVWAIGRDSSVWERPLEFLPERFLGSHVDLQGQHFELLPFGSGRRRCAGLTFAMLNVHLMLATLLQAFSWSIPSKTFNGVNNTKHVDMAEKFGITMIMAKHVCCMATPRLPPHVLQLFYSS